MTSVLCKPGCTCLRHRVRTPAEREQLGAKVRAATQRRKRRAEVTGYGRRVHRRCVRCGRLLAPDRGKMPAHRCPPPRTYGRKHVPLTGADAPWCEGKMFV